MAEISEAEADKKPKTSETISALVLSASALLTAYASYEAQLWDGEQASHYTRANALRVEASRAALTANQEEGADLMVFGAWLGASAQNQTALQDFYRNRFRPDFASAFDAWAATKPLITPGAPPTPFAMPQYALHQRARADALEHSAQQTYDVGQRDNDISDSFVLATVILANALFFGGINQVLRHPLTQKILLSVAVISCLVATVFIATLPPA